MAKYGKGPFKPGAAPYKGHQQMCSDISHSEHGTDTKAGRGKVTEGRRIDSPTGGKGPHGKGRKKGAE